MNCSLAHCLSIGKRLHRDCYQSASTVLSATARFFPSLRLLAASARIQSRGKMETVMTYQGTVRSFDQARRRGTIEADSGGEYLLFELSGVYQKPNLTPVVGQRLTYNLVTSGGRRCAVNLDNV